MTPYIDLQPPHIWELTWLKKKNSLGFAKVYPQNSQAGVLLRTKNFTGHHVKQGYSETMMDQNKQSHLGRMQENMNIVKSTKMPNILVKMSGYCVFINYNLIIPSST